MRLIYFRFTGNAYDWASLFRAPLKNNSDNPWLTRAARALWLVLVAVAILLALLVKSPRHRGIYDLFSLAGRNWLTGANIYAQKDGFLVFRNAPIVAVFLTPLAKLPDMLGSFLFRAVNVGVMAAGASAFLRQAVRVRPGSRAEAVYWLVLAPLAMNGMVDLQVNALATGLMLLAIAGLAASRWNFVAACLTGAILLKIYPVSLMLLCIVLWPRELGWRCAVALLIASAAPFLFQRPAYVWNQYHRWFHLMSANGRQHLPLHEWYRDIRLPLEIVGVHISSGLYCVIQLVAAAVVGASILWLNRNEIDRKYRLGILYGLAAGWMMAFGPATEGVTYIMFAPAAAWLAAEAISQPHGRVWRLAVAGLAGILAATDLSTWFPHTRAFRDLSPQPVVTIAIMFMLIALRLRIRVSHQPSASDSATSGDLQQGHTWSSEPL